MDSIVFILTIDLLRYMFSLPFLILPILTCIANPVQAGGRLTGLLYGTDGGE